MKKEYRYSLERGNKKYECPQCHRRSFKRYVDNYTGEHLDPKFGACDHLNSCGYSLNPYNYWRLHPDERNDLQVKDYQSVSLPKIKPVIWTMPMKWVEAKRCDDSMLCPWMRQRLKDDKAIDKVLEAYKVGVTKDDRVIYWQIDTEGRVRTGKTMKYHNNGHRDGNAYFLHTDLIDKGLLDDHWYLTQCFFGEHLLKERPNDPVAVVESEKSALICSVCYPQYVWIATGGCENLNASKCAVLKGRRVYIFPDSGCLEKWKKKMKDVEDVQYSFVESFEQYEENTDLADVILGEAKKKP